MAGILTRRERYATDVCMMETRLRPREKESVCKHEDSPQEKTPLSHFDLSLSSQNCERVNSCYAAHLVCDV